MCREPGARDDDQRPATLKLIGDLGIDCAQGYHVGKPAPVIAFTRIATDV